MKRLIIGLLVAAFVIAAAVWFVNNNNDSTPASQADTSQTAQTEQPQEAAAGRQYADYSEAELANEYERHILFFHAIWCPECRAFERELLSGSIPEGVQILKVDYDTATELKQKYGVTLQTTFVEVDADGNELAKWVGYGQDKSFEAIDAGLSGG